jgi:hypothetical protein
VVARPCRRRQRGEVVARSCRRRRECKGSGGRDDTVVDDESAGGGHETASIRWYVPFSPSDHPRIPTSHSNSRPCIPDNTFPHGCLSVSAHGPPSRSGRVPCQRLWSGKPMPSSKLGCRCNSPFVRRDGWVVFPKAYPHHLFLFLTALWLRRNEGLKGPSQVVTR